MKRSLSDILDDSDLDRSCDDYDDPRAKTDGKIFIVEGIEVEPGTEKKLQIPVGAEIVYYAWKGMKDGVNEYSAYGAIGKGLTPTSAIKNLLKLLKRTP